jgi:iron-sulfur cluster assembly protein
MSLLKIKRKGERQPLVESSNEQIEILPKNQLGISDAAALRIDELMREKDDENLYFRVAIRGGGCSGLSIHYEWTKDLRPNDLIFSKNNARVIIDSKSLSILGGATLHCRNYLGSVEFMLENNPSAKQCSCGQSFSL